MKILNDENNKPEIVKEYFEKYTNSKFMSYSLCSGEYPIFELNNNCDEYILDRYFDYGYMSISYKLFNNYENIKDLIEVVKINYKEELDRKEKLDSL